jgi:hypothetical protein
MAKLEKYTKEYSILGLVRDLKNGMVNRDAEMQRSYVWGNKEQTEYLDSVFQSATTYIPPIIGAETENEIEIKGEQKKIIDLLDGKQRSTTVEKFINNEIKLGYNINPVIIEQEDETEKTYNIAGLRWEELPEEVKLLFKACKIQMIYFKNMSFADRERQFIKLQGGKKLSNAEINKVRIGQEIREFIYKQLATDLWSKHVNISKNREVKFETMQQVLMVAIGKFGLSGKELQAFSEDCLIDNEDMEKIEAITEYLNKVTRQIKINSLPKELQNLEDDEIIEKLDNKQVKKYLKPIDFLKKVNVPIIYRVAGKALKNNINPEQFAEFLINFFEDIDARYKRFTESGNASNTNVQGRLEVLDKKLIEAFKIVEETITNDEEEQEQNQEQEHIDPQQGLNNIMGIIGQNNNQDKTEVA